MRRMSRAFARTVPVVPTAETGAGAKQRGPCTRRSLDFCGGAFYVMARNIINEDSMSKAHRGSGIRELQNSGRGKCPVCKRTGIKVLYELEINEKKFSVCKQCKAAIAKGKRQEEVAAITQ